MADIEQHVSLTRPEFSKPVKVLIVVAPYYGDIAAQLIAGATAEILAAGGQALGCVIRGETSHYDTVCNDSSRGLTLLGLQGLCIGNGILTVENMAQAEERADPAKQNKGGVAAAAALHLIALSRKWGAQRKGIGFRPASDEIQLASGNSTA